MTKPVAFFFVIPDSKCTREADRFLVVFKSGDSEVFEWQQDSETLSWIETEKSREHDCALTGIDFSHTL